MQDWYFSGAVPIFSNMLKAFEFCIPTRSIDVPTGPEWLHEIKFDGYRLRAERNGDRVRLITKGTLSMRKANLARLLARRPDGIFMSEFEQDEIGPDLFGKACEFGLEGLVSKRRDRLSWRYFQTLG
jgi:ATP-dependent DNA ligase